MGGPIPSRSIREAPVQPDEWEAFRRCMRAADAAYLEISHREDKRDPHILASPAPGLALLRSRQREA